MKTNKKTKLYEWRQKAKTAECEKCQSKTNVTVDHIIPISLLRDLGSPDGMYWDEENFQFLCVLCNSQKANRIDHLNPKTIPLLKKYIKIFEELSTPPPIEDTKKV